MATGSKRAKKPEPKDIDLVVCLAEYVTVDPYLFPVLGDLEGYDPAKSEFSLELRSKLLWSDS